MLNSNAYVCSIYCVLPYFHLIMVAILFVYIAILFVYISILKGSNQWKSTEKWILQISKKTTFNYQRWEFIKENKKVRKKEKKIDQEIDQEKKENNLSCTRLILIISRTVKWHSKDNNKAHTTAYGRTDDGLTTRQTRRFDRQKDIEGRRYILCWRRWWRRPVEKHPVARQPRDTGSAATG